MKNIVYQVERWMDERRRWWLESCEVPVNTSKRADDAAKKRAIALARSIQRNQLPGDAVRVLRIERQELLVMTRDELPTVKQAVVENALLGTPLVGRRVQVKTIRRKS